MASFKTFIGTEVCADIPVGALTAYCGNFAFSATNQIEGWILCDGTTYTNADGRYNSLLNLNIGSGTQNVNYTSPNLSGRMPLSRDAATNNTMNIGGENQHTLNVAEYPSHTHNVNISKHSDIVNLTNHTHTYTEWYNDDNVVGYGGEGDNVNMGYVNKGTEGHSHNHASFNSGNVFVPAANSAYGNSKPFSILNKHVGVRWLLKY